MHQFQVENEEKLILLNPPMRYFIIRFINIFNIVRDINILI